MVSSAEVFDLTIYEYEREKIRPNRGGLDMLGHNYLDPSSSSSVLEVYGGRSGLGITHT